MNQKVFNTVIKDQIEKCLNTLGVKATEYAENDDRLHNFKNAAGMMNCDPKEALAGMMAKHTISIYDMCRSGESYPLSLWEEKIGDHINYLLLLKALIVEDGFSKCCSENTNKKMEETNNVGTSTENGVV